MNRRLALAPVRTIAFGTEPGPGPPRDQSTPLVNNAAWAGYGAIRGPAYIPEVPVRGNPISTLCSPARVWLRPARNGPSAALDIHVDDGSRAPPAVALLAT
jgi:hypothetical protein